MAKIKGLPRGIVERAASEILAAVARGVAVPESALPSYPKGKRWARDPDFDTKVGHLKGARDSAAKRLEIDPGVLCSRDRMETIARVVPKSVEELAAIGELRKWQVVELGAEFVKALSAYKPVPGAGPELALGDVAAGGAGESPYRQ